MITPENPRALTADDLIALRAADSVTWHIGPTVGEHTTDRETTCTASLRERHASLTPRILTAGEQRALRLDSDGFERRRSIPCDGRVMSWAVRYPGTKAWTGYAHVTSGDEAWPTVAASLKVGDVLTLKITADCQTGALTDAGFAVDTAYLKVARGKRDLTFELDTRVARADQSVNRMVTPA